MVRKESKRHLKSTNLLKMCNCTVATIKTSLPKNGKLIKCKLFCKPFPTNEKSPFNSKSIYSLTKQHQEQISKMIGETYGYNVVICRYFNCYGSRL